MTSKVITKERILKAIEGSNGIITDIAKRIDAAWSTTMIHINKYPETIQALQDERERVSDIAENILISDIKSGNPETAKWWLKCLAKNRGFVEKSQIEVSGELVYSVIPAKESK